MSRHQTAPVDKQTPQSGKVENDSNKQGHQSPTQLNQSKRTPNSRSDREDHIGSANQVQARKGPNR